jgi:hypothetical protein
MTISSIRHHWRIHQGLSSERDTRRHRSCACSSGTSRRPAEPITARITFEVSDGVRPMQLYCAGAPLLKDGSVHVSLEPRPASCKPRDRWLAETNRPTACCGPREAASGGCG